MEIWEEDLYGLLGVIPEAGAEEIRKAYKKLAVELHPDRYPEDEAARAEAGARFAKITNAYNILKNEEERAEYDFARRMGFGAGAAADAGFGGAGADEAVDGLKRSQAENQYEQGRVYHRGKNWQKAIACYKEAVRLDPTVADYHAHLGLAFEQQGLATSASKAYAAALRLDKQNKIARERAGAGEAKKGGKKGAKGKKKPEPQGILGMLKALLDKLNQPVGGGKKPAKKGAKKGTASLKKAGARK